MVAPLAAGAAAVAIGLNTCSFTVPARLDATEATALAPEANTWPTCFAPPVRAESSPVPLSGPFSPAGGGAGSAPLSAGAAGATGAVEGGAAGVVEVVPEGGATGAVG